MLLTVFKTSDFQGTTIKLIVPTGDINTAVSLSLTTKFSSAWQFKNHNDVFSSFKRKGKEAKKRKM